MARPRFAAIDLGSNTVHLLVARPRRKREGLKHLHSSSELLELGREVMEQQTLSRESIEAVTAVLQRQLEIARAHRVEGVAIGATGVFRRARNGRRALQQIERAIGAPIHLLSERREAQLAFRGAHPVLKPRATQLVIDSGGASTELVLARGLQPAHFASLPVGAAMLCSQLRNDPPLPLEWAKLMLLVADALEKAPVELRPTRAVALGGTAHRFEELALAHGHDKALRLRHLERLSTQLLQHPSKRVARMTGNEPRKMALLTAGALILYAVMTHYRLKKLKVAHVGLRDGMIEAFRAEPSRWWREART